MRELYLHYSFLFWLNSFLFSEQDLNSTDQSECGSEKSLAYIEISKKLVSDVRENFPTCKYKFQFFEIGIK